jgi:hypothetical protein
MDLEETEARNDCAGENQQQITALLSQISKVLGKLGEESKRHRKIFLCK